MEQAAKRNGLDISRRLISTEHASDQSRPKKALDSVERTTDTGVKRGFKSIEHLDDAALKRVFDSIGDMSDLSVVKRRFDSIAHYSDMNDVKRDDDNGHVGNVQQSSDVDSYRSRP